jgi:hypothetical protein
MGAIISALINLIRGEKCAMRASGKMSDENEIISDQQGGSRKVNFTYISREIEGYDMTEF